jgi:diaminopimelate decarboxylase
MTWLTDALRARLHATLERAETPLRILDVEAISRRYRALSAAWSAHFPSVELAYSYKTNSSPCVTRALLAAGASAEVVSGLELSDALADGFPPPRIYFDGPLKRPGELARALRLGAFINLDSLDDLRTCLASSAFQPGRSRVGLRLSAPRPDGSWSRFGFTAEEVPAALQLLRSAGAGVSGVHLHLGSNLPDPALHAVVLAHYAPLLQLLRTRSSRTFTLDLGGGFPAWSAAGAAPYPDSVLAARVAGTLTATGVPLEGLHVVLEPGRCLVEEHGYLLARVSVRKTRGERRLVVLDAGTNHVRSLRDWPHRMAFLSADPAECEYDVYGWNCFESDVFALALPGPAELPRGAPFVVADAGGYDVPSTSPWIRAAPQLVTWDASGVHLDRERPRALAASSPPEDPWNPAPLP